MLVYINKEPFVVSLDKNETHRYVDENLFILEERKAEIDRLNAALLKFAYESGLIENMDGVLKPILVSDTGDWRWTFLWFNFRSVINVEQYSLFVNSLSGYGGRMANVFVDLYTRINMTFDTFLLDTLATKVIESLGIIPFEVEEEKRQSWTTVYTQTPFIWVAAYLQNLIKNTITFPIGAR